MLQRIVQVLVGIIAAVVILGVVTVIVRDQLGKNEEVAEVIHTKKPVIPAPKQPGPKVSQPQSQRTPAAPTRPAPAEYEERDIPEDPSATPSPAYRIPQRKFTWGEVEAILDKLRDERKQRPEARDDLESWYTYLASPQYTESKDLPEHCAKLAQWRRDFPDSPNPLVVLGRVHIHWAWEARGSGWASTVTKEGWEQFHTR